jgi:hypothetical protein
MSKKFLVVGRAELVDPDYFASELAPKPFVVLTVETYSNEPLWVEGFDTLEEAIASAKKDPDMFMEIKEG